jgi:hypothetical protein
MRNTADVTGGKPIAVWTQSISGAIAINPLVAFYDTHGGGTTHETTLLHTYHSRFIPEGLADVSQIFLQDTHFFTKIS